MQGARILAPVAIEPEDSTALVAHLARGARAMATPLVGYSDDCVLRFEQRLRGQVCRWSGRAFAVALSGATLQARARSTNAKRNRPRFCRPLQARRACCRIEGIH